MKRSLFKYFTRSCYANDFLDGKLLFRSLAYFRDDEDLARGDQYEGTTVFRPEGGLHIHNQTHRTHSTLPLSFESSVKAHEIFVYCVSQTFSPALVQEFGAVACVEITQISVFCERIRSALPASATFKTRAVDYYAASQEGSPRWALPDAIATSKLDYWARQNEYRFLFSLTGALGFEEVKLRLVDRNQRPARIPDHHQSFPLQTTTLRDFCRLHDVNA